MAFAVAGVVALSGGCTADRQSASRDDRQAPDARVDVVDSQAREEVRAGIDAFNLGDYETTVEHFAAAVPLAEKQDDGSKTAADLVEAVRYYAGLEAGQYPEAARSSPDFAKYKAITLGQCRPVGEESAESPGTNV